MSSEASERWLEISEKFQVGPKRRNGLLRSSALTDDVAPGQLRQAYWEDASVVIIIDSIDADAAQAIVLPVTLEPGIEDAAAVIIAEEASPLYSPITVWPATRVSVPFVTLGATIATLPMPQLRAIKEVSSNASIAAGLREGHAEPPLGSGAALAIADLFDAIDVLKTAPRFQLAGLGAPTVKLQVPLATIMSALQASQPRAMAIRMGKEPLTVEEADRLAEAAEVPVDQILSAVAPLPAELQRELQEPHWRPHIRKRAIDGDEARARTLLGYEAYQLAARESGQGRDRWRQRLETVLATDSQ